MAGVGFPRLRQVGEALLRGKRVERYLLKIRRMENAIRKILDHSEYTYQIAHTEYQGHATGLARDARDKGYDIIAAAGGDGTVNEVASALVGTETALMLIPTGSGNGLARHIRVPSSPRAALSSIRRLHAVKIDTVTISPVHVPERAKIFVSTAGAGFDSLVAQCFARYGKRGFASYLNIVRKELFRYPVQSYQLTFGTNSCTTHAFLLTFANSSQYGANAVIAPRASVTDGAVDICILKKFPMRSVPKLVYQLFSHRINRSRYYENIHTPSFTIRMPDPIIHLDGDPYELDTHLKVEVNPASLKILAPKIIDI